MKTAMWKAVVLVAGAAALAIAAPQGLEKVVPVKPHATFDRLRALVGEWEGTNGKGQPARISYRLTSGGTMLLETLASKDPGGNISEMVTTYYLDGDKIMMTHYCAGNTQPRMVATSTGGNEIQFMRKDVTNLPGRQWGAMRAMKLTLLGKDEITQTWTWQQDGKDFPAELFQFERKH